MHTIGDVTTYLGNIFVHFYIVDLCVVNCNFIKCGSYKTTIKFAIKLYNLEYLCSNMVLIEQLCSFRNSFLCIVEMLFDEFVITSMRQFSVYFDYTYTILFVSHFLWTDAFVMFMIIFYLYFLACEINNKFIWNKNEKR